MNLKNLKQWDEERPGRFARLIFKDGRVKVGILKNMHPGNPNYPGGGVQTEDYFYFQIGKEIEVYNVKDIETITEA